MLKDLVENIKIMRRMEGIGRNQIELELKNTNYIEKKRSVHLKTAAETM